ncbi:MAG TPA: hypothetical protein VFB62_22590, partial [Polyangiaceae bacterium]|nr:hypothetical protein [Polyangiaceae bacterium]
ADRRALELAKAAADVASVVDARRRAPPPTRVSAPLPLARPTPAPPPPIAKRTPPPPRPNGANGSNGSNGHAVHREGRPRRPVPTHRPSEMPTPARDLSSVVPPLPPEPRVINFRRLDFQLDESEEDTFIRPETLLRRALLAIDPDYARRTEYAPGEKRESNGHEETGDPPDTQMETQRRRRSSPEVAPPNGSLATFRVAVLPIPEDGDVRLLFLPPGADAPTGVATALLVAPTERDAELLAKVYAECNAKL